jgi:hypothetical protein
MQRVTAVILAVVLSGSILYSGTADYIRNLTGSHTRLVWAQDQGAGKDPFAKGTNLKLMGFDTEDGKGERAILGTTGSYARPLLTPSGTRVIYSDIPGKKVYVVNFNGTNRRYLCTGFATDTWQDPGTGKEWVVVQPENSNSARPVRRHLIDTPATGVLVWDKTVVGHCYFQISGDGKRAAGAFPWSDCGMAVLNNVSWKKFGNGCWTSIAPDNSYTMWIFDGLHRNVQLYDGNGTRKAKIALYKAPGIRGWEVYHPRWSENRKDVIVMTGPYSAGSTGSCSSGNCGNKISQGGTNVEVYIGKLDAGLTRVTGWVKVTANSKGDFSPDAWVSTGPVKPDINLSPTKLNFTALPGGPDPAPQTVTVTPVGGQPLSALMVTESAGWLANSVSLTSTKVTITNKVILGTLGNGTYTTRVTVKVGTITKTYDVVLTVGALQIKMNAGINPVSGWGSDGVYVSGGSNYQTSKTFNVDVANAGPQELYQTCRHLGPTFTYNIPNAAYLVRLHFAEPYHTNLTDAAKRNMTVKIEGQTVLHNFNPGVAAGACAKAYVYDKAVAVADGNGLIIEFIDNGGDAFVMGIEVTATGTNITDHRYPATGLKSGSVNQAGDVIYTLKGDRLQALDRLPAGIYIIKVAKKGRVTYKKISVIK